MNQADASKPQFVAAWWTQHKASGADPQGKFATALQSYEAARKKFQDDASKDKGGASAHSPDGVKATLAAVKKEALAQKGSLGTFQKETVTALDNYARKVDAWEQDLTRVGTAPLVKETVKFLVKQAPQFQEYCKKNFQSESYNFLSLMYKKPIKEKRWYEDFIKPGGKFEVNIQAATKFKFADIAKAVETGAKPDSPATWEKAPWDKAVEEVEKMLQADVVPRFRNYTRAVMISGMLPR